LDISAHYYYIPDPNNCLEGKPVRVNDSGIKDGTIEVEVEDSDDLWHLYNIIDKGDRVCGNTMREVKISRIGEEERAGRRRVFLCISVEDLGFQTFTERLRIKGRVITGPEDMNIQGSYHSFSVGIRDRLSITKDAWLSFHLDRLRMAKSKERPKALIVTIDDQESSLFILRDYDSQELVSMQSHMPGKYVESGDRSLIRSKFFDSIGDEVGRVIAKEKMDIVIAGPGFAKNELAKYLRERFRVLKLNVFEETTSSTGAPAVREVLHRGALSKVMNASTLIRDTHLVDELLSRLSSKPGLVGYGMEEVGKAVERGAVESLLVSERLFKESDAAERMAIEGICKKAESYGGRVYFVGGEHEKGRQLVSLGGIAALLRFPI
jgi:protein pelota